MFQRLKSTKKLWNANKAATRVTPLIAASLFPASAPAGGFDSRLRSDTFVIGYIYGVITAACGEGGDHEEQGYFVQQVFEQLFPDHGKEMSEFCISQVVQKNSDFKQYTGLGFREMIELVSSDGHKPLLTLLEHISERY